YKLVARGKDGTRLLAGITYTTAPNVHVLIQVKEDLATSATPEVPGSPTLPADKKSDPKIGDGKTSSLGRPSAAGNNLPQLPPVAVPTPAKPANPAGGGWVPGIADNGMQFPPALSIPNPTPQSPAPPPLNIPQSAPMPAVPVPTPPMSVAPISVQSAPSASLSVPSGSDAKLAGPARVPSCVLVGNKLVNFALNDVNGTPWEFKTQRRGKLVLLDFWSTTCMPCRETSPMLRQLQSQYLTQGLEVVGIATEENASQEQAYRVNALAQKLQLNYRQLIAAGGQCPVRTQFAIRFVPTLVLVDESGAILWRHEGKPDRNTMGELERLIQRRLGKAA
ncbi:MAG TPA: redoxin domain-containing protein, partial [Bryobacteraceae bacterium]|nr:redoxin domain-containing protein [Bryobacteraceae bacterium]